MAWAVSHPGPLTLATGGFNKFQTEYSEHCETNVDSSSSPSGSPPTSVLGLGGLRISSDCSDGESDRELPSSATESDGSPVPSSQPAFPVQILPYLYLGCAKDSTNLDVLGKYGIKYILNVTPNLPNAFEHGGEFTYKQIPISDHWSQNLSQFFPEAISFIGRCCCSLGGVGGQLCRGVYGTWVSLAPGWVPLGLSKPVRALLVLACARGRTHACCESPRPLGPKWSPESWTPPPAPPHCLTHGPCCPACVSVAPLFWAWLAEASQLSDLPQVLPARPHASAHVFSGRGLPLCLFGLYFVPEGAKGWCWSRRLTPDGQLLECGEPE